MNAIAMALHSRALLTPPHRDPHLLHGVLLMLELGIGPGALARLTGLSAGEVETQAAAARRGDCGRERPWMGERMASEVRRAVAHERRQGNEMFLTPWHRAAIELLARPEGALSGELMAAALRFGKVLEGSKLLVRLRDTLAREGFPVHMRPNAVGNAARYRFSEADRLRMVDVIANGWVVL